MNPSFPEEELSRVLAQIGESSDGFQVVALGDQVTAGATAGVWRVSASATSSRRWSVILKLIHHSSTGHRYWPSSADVAHPMYWKREALVLADPRLQSARRHLRPPRLLGAHTEPSSAVRLWQEDAPGTPGHAWGIHDYELAARHLGQFQGEFAARGALPEDAWWSRNWVRAYIERRADRFAFPLPRDVLQHPVLNAALGADISARVAALWSARNETLALLDQTPRTLCHNDFWTKNLFHEPAPHNSWNTVAIDWAYAGIGALGSDIATLMADAINDRFIASEQTEALSNAVFGAYRAGLLDAGLDIDMSALRFAYCATVALKYLWIVPDLVSMAGRMEPKQPLASDAEQLFGTRSRFVRHLLALADEADLLRESIG